MAKLKFDSTEIILICWFGAQLLLELILLMVLIINVENRFAA